MKDIVLRMKCLPDLTNEKAWEVVYEGANEIERLRSESKFLTGKLEIAEDAIKELAGRCHNRLATLHDMRHDYQLSSP